MFYLVFQVERKMRRQVKMKDQHFVKSGRIRSYSGPHFSAFGLRVSPYSVRMRKNTDQNNFEEGNVLRSVDIRLEWYVGFQYYLVVRKL